MVRAHGFRSMKAAQLLRILRRKLGYREMKRSGSHRLREAPGWNPITFAYHDRVELSPVQVRQALLQTRLTLDEA